MKKTKTVLLYLFLAWLLAGCVTIQVPEEFKGSGVFEVVLVQPTAPTPIQAAQAAQAAQPTAVPTDTPPPTLAPTVTPTSLPASPTASPTPAALTVLIEVKLNANCRLGPGVTYPVARYLAAGLVVELLAQDSTGSWGLARETAADPPCWISLRALAEAPEIANLPVITPAAALPGAPASQPAQDDSRTRPGTNPGDSVRPTNAPPPPPAPTEEPYPPPSNPPDPYP